MTTNTLATQTTAAAALHADALVINAMDPTDIKQGDDQYVDKLRRGGLTAVVHAVHISDATLRTGIGSIMEWRRRYSEFPDELMLATKVSDVLTAKRENRTAVFLSFEDSTAVEKDLTNVELLHSLGLRFMGLTYQDRNLSGDGCGEDSDAGLSKLGRGLIKECNRLGVVIDLSHTGFRSSMEAVELSEKPVLVTHGALRTFVDSCRNKVDEELKAVAAAGGLIGVATKSGYIKENGQNTGTTPDDYIDNLVYLADLVGTEHIIVGTDVGDERRYTPEGMARTRKKHPELPIFGEALDVDLIHPKGMDTPAGMPLMTEAMLRRGFSEEDIRAILGLNMMRVLPQIFGEE